MADQPVELGIDIELWIVVVVVGDEKKPSVTSGFESDDGTQVVTEMPVAQPLKRFGAGEAVTEGRATAGMELVGDP